MKPQAARAALSPEAAIESPDRYPTPTHEEIGALAHALWEARGCPEGSPEEDWLRAERELKSGSLSKSVIDDKCPFYDELWRPER